MVFNSAFSSFIRKRMYSIDLVRKQPVDVQRALFANLLHEGKHTSFGREAGFKSIRHWRDFKRIVPIRTYDEFKPWIDRAKAGESDVLWPGVTQWFAKSSGTSSDRSKFLPVTKASLESCHYKGRERFACVVLRPTSRRKIIRWQAPHSRRFIFSGSTEYRLLLRRLECHHRSEFAILGGSEKNP